MFEKVDKQRIICKLKFHFDGGFETINLSGDLPYVGQRFYESVHSGKLDVNDTYFSKGSFTFSENSSPTESGILYKQQITMRFPSNDLRRGARIDMIHKVKFVEMILNDSTSYIMGRNDITQNRRPSIETDSGLHMTQVKISSESIQPVIKVHNQSSESEVLFGYDYIYEFELS